MPCPVPDRVKGEGFGSFLPKSGGGSNYPTAPLFPTALKSGLGYLAKVDHLVRISVFLLSLSLFDFVIF